MNDFGMGVGMWVFWIAIIVFVVLVIKVMMNGNTSQGDKIIDSSTNDSPMDILKKRYASGEINQDEFENMKKELEKQTGYSDYTYSVLNSCDDFYYMSESALLLSFTPARSY